MTRSGWLVQLFNRVEISLIVYVVTINVLSFILTVIGYFALRNRGFRMGQAEVEALLNSPMVPGITIVAPAHNEELIVRDSVRSMLSLRHPNHEVIVVNDGSTDGTLAALIDEFHLYRSSRSGSNDLPSKSIRAVYESRDPIHLVVLDKEHGGKADSLNAGINHARLPLLATVDCDSLLERDALLYLEQPFLEDPEYTVAAGGIIHVVNGCEIKRASSEKCQPLGPCCRDCRLSSIYVPFWAGAWPLASLTRCYWCRVLSASFAAML